MCSALRCTSAVVLEYVQCSAEFLRLDRHGNSLGRDVLWTPETCACWWDRDLELCAMLSVALCIVFVAGADFARAVDLVFALAVLASHVCV